VKIYDALQTAIRDIPEYLRFLDRYVSAMEPRRG
jgi:hypothetical protein